MISNGVLLFIYFPEMDYYYNVKNPNSIHLIDFWEIPIL